MIARALCRLGLHRRELEFNTGAGPFIIGVCQRCGSRWQRLPGRRTEWERLEA